MFVSWVKLSRGIMKRGSLDFTGNRVIADVPGDNLPGACPKSLWNWIEREFCRPAMKSAGHFHRGRLIHGQLIAALLWT